MTADRKRGRVLVGDEDSPGGLRSHERVRCSTGQLNHAMIQKGALTIHCDLRCKFQIFAQIFNYYATAKGLIQPPSRLPPALTHQPFQFQHDLRCIYTSCTLEVSPSSCFSSLVSIDCLHPCWGLCAISVTNGNLTIFRLNYQVNVFVVPRL